MADIGNIVGDEFEKNYKDAEERRREKARKIGRETLEEICYKAIEGGGWTGEEPRMTFDDGDIEHDVVLMESPEEDIDKYIHKLGDSGALSVGMFHQGMLWSCVFNDELIDQVDKIEEDEAYLVAGRYTENEQEQDDGSTRTYINIAPVRGILPLAVAKEFAENFEDRKAASDPEEQAEQQAKEDDDSSGDVDIGGLMDDEEESKKDEILEVFNFVGDEKPDVLRSVADGDMDMLEKLTEVVNSNIDGEATIEEVGDIFEEEVDEIEGRSTEEEEEDDGIDLDNLDSDDGEEEEEESEDEEDGDNDSEEETDDEDEEDEGVEDWF